MKRNLIGLCSLLLILSMALPCVAEVMPYPTLSSPSLNSSCLNISWPRLIDEADLLSAEEEEELLLRLDTVGTRYECDIVIVTRNESITGDIQEEADEIYDQAGYGFGEEKSGILLLISMESREWALSTCGGGITVFSDGVQDYLMEQTLPYLSNGEYARAFRVFVTLAEDQLKYAGSEEFADPELIPDPEFTKPAFPAVRRLLTALVIGLLSAWIATGTMKRKLKSVRGQVNASQYAVNGSFRVTESRDLFLYHTVNRVPKPTNPPSGGNRPGGGGHSTVHTSSSGRSHGGSHGKF